MKKSITLVIIVIALLSTVLLIANRIGYEWAGGSGIEKHEVAISDGYEYRRGQVIRSDDEIKMVEFVDARFFMEPNTEVRIESGLAEDPVINVIKGRIVVNGPMTVATREVRTKSYGLLSYVHYSWEDVVEIASVSGEATVSVEDLEQTLVGEALKTYTLPPYAFEEIEFNPTESSASAFYNAVCEIWGVCL